MHNQQNVFRNALVKFEKILENADESHAKVVLGYYKQMVRLRNSVGLAHSSPEGKALRILKRSMLGKCNLEECFMGIREKAK